MGGTSSSSHPPSSASTLLSSRRSASSSASSSSAASAAASSGSDAVAAPPSASGGAPKPPGVPAPYVRRARHSGSWYSSSPSELNRELDVYLRDAESEGGGERRNGEERSGGGGRPRGCVSPHAGFRYSGPTAAYAYLALGEALATRPPPPAAADEGGASEGGSAAGVENGGGAPAGGGRRMTVVVLHPSHHVRLDGCAVSGATVLETPIADLRVDSDLRSDLLRTGEFTTMERRVDEAEHSGEMQYPYIAKVAADAAAAAKVGGGGGGGGGPAPECLVLPVMVGALDPIGERRYGRVLAPYLSRPDVFTVVSSDFCHWGRRFGYVPRSSPPYSPPGGGVGGRGGGDIADYIEWLDRRGMDHIESQRPGAFADYLRRYSNTICGRHPIGVWLCALSANSEAGAERLDVRFVRYAQSGRVRDEEESSVSYASAVARVAAST